LSGYTRDKQTEILKSITERGWNKYRITDNVDSIVECTLIDDPNFDDLDTMTGPIESGTLEFIEDVDDFLSKH
jgi:hypothetical protein